MLMGFGGDDGHSQGQGPIMPRGRIQPFSAGISKSERVLCDGTDGSVEQVTANIAAAVQQYGPPPGAKKMMSAEQAAAEEAMRTGLYGIWRNPLSGSDFCGRIGPESRCFCDHGYSQHRWTKDRRERAPACELCPCKGFKYIPRRPEEVGEYWLPRRRGFDINIWRPKCKCNMGHDNHDPNSLACPGRRGKYTSAWMCIACDGKWEDHESLWESEEERRLEGKSVGQAFMPLSSTPDIQQAVLHASESSVKAHALPARPKPERSIKLMQERCPNYGGAAALANSSIATSSLEDAFPPRGAAAGRGGCNSSSTPTLSLEDAFPPRGSSGGGPGGRGGRGGVAGAATAGQRSSAGTAGATLVHAAPPQPTAALGSQGATSLQEAAQARLRRNQPAAAGAPAARPRRLKDG